MKYVPLYNWIVLESTRVWKDINYFSSVEFERLNENEKFIGIMEWDTKQDTFRFIPKEEWHCVVEWS